MLPRTRSPSVVDRFVELASDIEVAMLTTVSSDGFLHSRPMGTLRPVSVAELWFFSRANATKVEEIEREQEVSLTYVDPVRHRYLAVSGRAGIVHDPAKAAELWTPLARIWFPEGPDDTDLRLLRVQPHHIEYWDTEEKRMKLLFDAARAAFGEKTAAPVEAHRPFKV